MREQHLPVLFRYAGREDADDLKYRADGENVAEVSRVSEATGQGADEEEEEDLHGADPRDVGGGAAEGRGVVGLEEAE